MKIEISINQQFVELLHGIEQFRSAASQAVNEKLLQTSWYVGGYVSSKLKNEEWGSNVVNQFAEYVRVNAPHLKGFGRRNIYNMVLFYEEYSSPSFASTLQKFLPSVIVQMPSAQFAETESLQIQQGSNQLDAIVQMPSAQLPRLLNTISFSNHIAILCNCKSWEQRLFYILYSSREKLTYKELLRCISNDTYSSLLGGKDRLSPKLMDTYPQSPVLFKDTAFVDFLGLPKKHSESQLRKGILEHMKEFILELGKDFLFVDQEYQLEVGASVFKVDLLFFHRGLQALVAVELKKTKFKPQDLGQLEFYLEVLDRDVKRSNENPSVGIILCPEADATVVEYALSRSMSPTMIAEYKRQLVPKEKMQKLLREYCCLLESDKGQINSNKKING